MEIRLPVSDLKTAIAGLSKIIPRQPTLPILAQVRVRRSPDGGVEIQGTCLDTFGTFRFPDQSGEPGEVLVPFDVLIRTVKGCSPTDGLTVARKGPGVVLRYLLAGRPVERPVDSGKPAEWPASPEFQDEGEGLDEHLKTAIAQALACSSDDPSRFALAGAWLDVTSRDAHYVMGTDGRHLFSANSFRLGLDKSVLIPSHRFLEWSGFRGDGGWRLNLQSPKHSQEDAWIQLASNRWTFAFRRENSEIPKWRLVVPENGTTTVLLGDKAMAFLLDALPALPGHDQTSRPVRLDVAAGSLTVTGCDPRAGHSTTLPVDDVDIRGTDLSITVNREFVIKAVKWGLNHLALTDSCTPLVFSNAGRRLLAMPMRMEGPEVTPAPEATAPAESTASPETDAGTEPEPQPNPEPEPMTKNRIPATTDTTEAEQPPTQPANRVPETPSDIPPASKPSIRTVLDQIDVLRDSLRSTVRQFGDVAEALRQIDKDRRTNDREVEVIREKLRALQGVRF